eukprot:TCONS_00003706-protein
MRFLLKHASKENSANVNTKKAKSKNVENFNTKKAKSKNLENVENGTSQPLPQANNISDANTSVSNENSTTSLHSNPRVIEAANIFEEGELKHEIKKCKICNEVRTVFHQAPQVQPILNKNDLFPPFSWSVREDGKCNRCYQEEKSNSKRKNPSAAPKFSGIFTNNDIEGNRVPHNNMHFENIPPYLQKLTLLETAMISKINTITNITILKYGMLRGKGHSIAVPNDMKIAKTLPNLPQEVGIILLRKKGANGEVLKEYTVRRDFVEKALTGLVFGWPNGGIEN